MHSMIRIVLMAFMIFCAAPGLAQSDKPSNDLVFFRCYVGQPSLQDLQGRLESALESLRRTDVEDDVQLALADVLMQQGKNVEALQLLEVVSKNHEATKLDAAYIGRGGMSATQNELAKARASHMRRFPDRSADHALLKMAQIHERQGQQDKAQKSLTQLRNRYPQGEHVQVDLEYFQSTTNAPGVRAGANVLVTEMLQPFERPHQVALSRLAALSQEQDKPDEQVDVLVEMLTLYGCVMGDERKKELARKGLKAAEAVEKRTGPSDGISRSRAVLRTFAKGAESGQ